MNKLLVCYYLKLIVTYNTSDNNDSLFQVHTLKLIPAADVSADHIS